jgi:hypothetical protein
MTLRQLTREQTTGITIHGTGTGLDMYDMAQYYV